VALFILFFLLIGGAVDALYFDAFTPAGPAVPIATIISLAFASCATVTAYYGGSDIILSSLGAEKLNLTIPEHRELHNIVTEMALASGAPMPRILVIYDPAPNALATGTNDKNAAICVTSGLLTALDRAGTDRLPLTHEFIAMMLGVRRAGVTVAAQSLQSAGLIQYAHGRVTIADREGLESAACECYEVTKREYARLLGISDQEKRAEALDYELTPRN